MQTALSFRTNRDLFSNHYLDEHLPETEAWRAVDEDDLRAAREDILDLWDDEKETAPDRNESQLEEKFIRPMFRKLGIPFEVEESVERGARRPDYGFFESREAATEAFKRRGEGEGFYEHAVAVADAKRWGRPLDTRGDHRHDFKNPSYQIHVYLQDTPTRWAVLTNGQKWRLYYGPTSHKLDSYYEVDLPTVLESGDLDAFKYFYLFFRHEAFLEDAGGDCFLDDVYEESNVFAQELGEDLQENIYEAIKVLSEGFLDYGENDLTEERLVNDGLLPTELDDFERARLSLIHDSALIYLYRLIFVLYAEADGRELLDTDNDTYEDRYSLNSLKQEVAEELDSPDGGYFDWEDELWSRLDDLFKLIDQGSRSRGIPEGDLYIPAYNGGLFRTAPDEDDSREARFLEAFEVGDAHLARVVELLTRSRNGNGGGKIFVDYSSLDIRHLGSVYEGLLEYKLNVADEPLALEEGEYAAAGEGDEVVVEAGEVYLTTDSGERKATGSYYTPEYVVEYIVENTLGPLVEEIRADLVDASDPGTGGIASAFAERVFELKVLDPAMGSGHFLTNAVDYLAREIIEAQDQQAEQEGLETVDQSQDIYWARRQVAQRCVYGVDLNPLAVELSKVSLWLRTLAAEQPLAFLDHHLKTGNSLVGSDIEDVLENGDEDTEEGQLTLHESFDRTRRLALEHVTERFQELLAIDNETLADVKEMESVFEEVRDDPLYQHLLAMANVHTADAFGLDVPGDAYERMAAALRDDSWEEIEGQDWFRSAQAMAAEERFFHWELEFPVAFYGDDGVREADAGFDAVIGNPPYISIENLENNVVRFLRNEYEATQYGRIDIYLAFMERSNHLCRRSCRYSMIVPDKWLVSDYGEYLRSTIIQNNTIEEIWDLRDVNVFEGVSNSPIVFRIRKEHPENGLINFRTGQFAEFVYDCQQSIFENTYEKKIIIGLNDSRADVIDKLDSTEERVRDFAYVSFGAQPGNLSKFVFDNESDAIDGACNLGFTESPEAVIKPFIRGRNIERFLIRYDGEYLVYAPDELHRPAFPELFEQSKIVISEISSTLKAAHDRERLFGNEKVVFVVRGEDLAEISEEIRNQRPIPDPDDISTFGKNINLDYLTGLLNSTLLEFYFEFAVSDGLNVYPDDIRYLPIIDPTDQGRLALESQQIAGLRSERDILKLDLLDYFGNYVEGFDLPDVGLFQPGSSNTLGATTEGYEKLRIGSVKTERSDETVTIYSTARYKPENEGQLETDRWGYTETDYVEAFTLTDLTETEAALVEAFVPVAVEEGDGFAGFRDNATKTTSLLDRLKAITLPDPDDVEDDLRRYLEAKERAEELDEKIEKTDRLIDEIVYELYGLTDEEIEIVEQAVGE